MEVRTCGHLAALTVALVVGLGACGGGADEEANTVATTSAVAPSTAAAGRLALPSIPDLQGSPVVPTPSGSQSPDKAWAVPDATGDPDWVSESDARFLAVARPVVPYSGPDGVVSNSTLIAIGREACAESSSYEAGGRTVAGPAAVTVRQAALPVYC